MDDVELRERHWRQVGQAARRWCGWVGGFETRAVLGDADGLDEATLRRNDFRMILA